MAVKGRESSLLVAAYVLVEPSVALSFVCVCVCACVHTGVCVCLFVCVQVSLRRLVYCAVRVMASMSQDVIIVTSSLTKDMTGKVGEGVVMIGVLRVCAYGCASLRSADMCCV